MGLTGREGRRPVPTALDEPGDLPVAVEPSHPQTGGVRLVAHDESLPERLWGISAEQDQNLGGILMSTEQALVFLAAIVWLLVRLFHEEAEAEERLAAEQRAAGLREH